MPDSVSLDHYCEIDRCSTVVEVINPRRLSNKKKVTGVTVRIWEHHGEGKPGLQASLTLMKKIKQKGFLCLHRYFICQLSSVQPYTRKPNQALTQVVEKWRSVKEEKPKPYIYAIKSLKPRYQNCGICRNISRTMYITATHTQKWRVCRHRQVCWSVQCPSLEPLLSWISGGRSMSATSTCTISFVKSSTENGMLHSEMQSWWGSMYHQADQDSKKKERGDSTWSHHLAGTSWCRRVLMDCLSPRSSWSACSRWPAVYRERI